MIGDPADPARVWVACDAACSRRATLAPSGAVYGTGLPNAPSDLLFYERSGTTPMAPDQLVSWASVRRDRGVRRA
jgi:hypothetical protein